MICSVCSEAADKKKYKLHDKCKNLAVPNSCDCQHRINARVIKSGGSKKDEGNNGDGS